MNITRTVPDILSHIDSDLQRSGLDVKAADIIDIMDGHKGAGHKENLPEELGEDIFNKLCSDCSTRPTSSFVSG